MTLTATVKKSIGLRRYRRLSRNVKDMFRKIDEANRLLQEPVLRPSRRD